MKLNDSNRNHTQSVHAHAQPVFPKWLLLMLGALGALGCIVILVSTRWGAVVTDDTFRYVASARSLAEGGILGWPTPEGELVPLTIYPPLVSITLTPFELVGIDALDAVRIMNAFYFSLTIFLTGVLVYQVTDTSGFSLLSASLVLTSKVLLEVDAAAMSEALYLVLTTMSFVFGVTYMKSRRIITLVGAGVVSGLAFLTRYIGISLIIALGILLLLDRERTWRRRLRDAFVFSVLSSLPMILWIVRNMVRVGGLINRTLTWHSLSTGWFIEGMRTVLLWFAPGRLIQDQVVVFFCIFIFLLLVFILLMMVWSRYRGPLLPGNSLKSMLFFFSSYIFLNFVVLFLSRALVATQVPLMDRLLAPVHHAGLIVLSIALAVIWRNTSKIPRTLIVTFCSVFFLFYAYRAVQSVQYMHQQGLGYMSRGWHSSEAIEVIKAHPDRPIYSNAATAIYFWTDRVTHKLSSNRIRSGFDRDCAFVVVFDAISLSLYSLSHEELSLDMIGRQVNDGWIYQHPACVEVGG